MGVLEFAARSVGLHFRRVGWAAAGIRVAALGAASAAVLLAGGILLAQPFPPTSGYVVFAANDLGMHCMQSDFSQMMILPPYNTLRAQVIRRGGSPEIMTSDVSVRYTIPGNTHSADKCNFWTFVQPLMGVPLPPDIGLAGFGLAGTMAVNTTRRDFAATGIPITPIDDSGIENPYPLAYVTAFFGGQVVASTQAVVPVSWEMSCNLCHNTPGISMATGILRSHDRLHGTDLEQHQPVFCAGCHADNALGAPGQPGVKSLSSAMHLAHAPRMNAVNLAQSCYACHPGERTQCLRDVHSANTVTCTACHGDMAAVGSPARNPWVDEPRCSSCHQRPNFEFEEPGKLYRDSKGHMGVACTTCHGSPHAITPTTTAVDNLQASRLQGHPGRIDNCQVCHTQTPGDPFPHRRNDD